MATLTNTVKGSYESIKPGTENRLARFGRSGRGRDRGPGQHRRPFDARAAAYPNHPAHTHAHRTQPATRGAHVDANVGADRAPDVTTPRY